MIFVLLDLCVCVLQRLSFERGLANQESVKNATHRPDVDLEAVTLFTENLWCDVIRGSTQGSLSLTIKVNAGRQSEIA